MKEYINIENVIKSKNARLYKMLPRFVLNYIKKILHEDRLNEDLRALEGLDTHAKFTTFLRRQNITVDIQGGGNVPKSGRFIFASNHPLGGVDGILFYEVVAGMFPGSKFLVNDILMNLPEVEDAFLPLNKHGKNSKEYFSMIDSAFESDKQMLIFPAGIVSRKVNGVVQDLQWRHSFINYAKKYKRDIIPVYIDSKNSNFFYNLANLRSKLGVKANLEMFYLVNEVYKKTDQTISIIFGEPISYEMFDKTKNIKDWVQFVRDKSYKLAPSK